MYTMLYKFDIFPGISRGSIYSDVAREPEPALGSRVSPSRSTFPQDKDTQDNVRFKPLIAT